MPTPRPGQGSTASQSDPERTRDRSRQAASSSTSDRSGAADTVRTAGERSSAVVLRRGVGYLLATLLVPGSVQLIAGRQSIGRVALRIWLALWGLVLLTVIAALIWRDAVLTLIGNGWTWKLAAPVVIALAIGWGALMVDSWRLSQPLRMSRRGRLGFAITALVLSVALVVAGIGVGRAANANGDLLRNVLGGGGNSDKHDGRYNVLLLGGDAGADRTGLRPDSMTVASIDADTGRTVLFSLPRNLEGAPFPQSSPLHKLYPNGYDCPDHSCLLNAVYTLAEEHTDLYPGEKNPGVKATTEVISELLGLQINYYAMIDLAGFTQLIDAVGGIRLDITKRVPIGGGTSRIYGYIEPGQNVQLNGYKALWFARSREGSSDYERMLRQKCVMNAMLNQLNPSTVVLKFQDMAKAGTQIAQTDVGSGDLNLLINLATKAKSKPISSVSFTPPLIYPGNPKLDVIRKTVADKIAASQALDDPSKATSKATSKAPAASPTSAKASAPSSAKRTASSSTTAPQAPATAQTSSDDLGSVCKAR